MLQQGSGVAAPIDGAPPADPLQEQLSGALDALQEIGASIARTESSLFALLGQAAAVGGGATNVQGVTDGFTALVRDASAFYSSTEDTGAEILRAAETDLGRAQALTRSLAVIRSDTDSSVAQSNAMLANMVLLADVLRSISPGSESLEESSPCLIEEAGGFQQIEFEVRKPVDTAGDGGVRRGRALLIGGGISSAAKQSTSTQSMEELIDSGLMTYSDALKATAAALQSNSWNLIKQYTSEKAISRLPAPPTETVAIERLSGGLLLYLQRKVKDGYREGGEVLRKAGRPLCFHRKGAPHAGVEDGVAVANGQIDR